MEKKLKKLSKRVNFFLNSYLSKFNSSELVVPMKYGLFPGGKKIRSKILVDIGYIFNVNYMIYVDPYSKKEYCLPEGFSNMKNLHVYLVED